MFSHLGVFPFGHISTITNMYFYIYVQARQFMYINSFNIGENSCKLNTVRSL